MELLLIVVTVFSSLYLIMLTALVISSIKLWTEFKAMKMSTHQIQYIDPMQEFEKASEKTKEVFEKDPFDNIA